MHFKEGDHQGWHHKYNSPKALEDNALTSCLYLCFEIWYAFPIIFYQFKILCFCPLAIKVVMSSLLPCSLFNCGYWVLSHAHPASSASSPSFVILLGDPIWSEFYCFDTISAQQLSCGHHVLSPVWCQSHH